VSARSELYSAALRLATLVNSGGSVEKVVEAYKALHMPIMQFVLEGIKQEGACLGVPHFGDPDQSFHAAEGND
jgi:hypothetical protein